MPIQGQECLDSKSGPKCLLSACDAWTQRPCFANKSPRSPSLRDIFKAFPVQHGIVEKMHYTTAENSENYLGSSLRIFFFKKMPWSKGHILIDVSLFVGLLLLLMFLPLNSFFFWFRGTKGGQHRLLPFQIEQIEKEKLWTEFLNCLHFLFESVKKNKRFFLSMANSPAGVPLTVVNVPEWSNCNPNGRLLLLCLCRGLVAGAWE